MTENHAAAAPPRPLRVVVGPLLAAPVVAYAVLSQGAVTAPSPGDWAAFAALVTAVALVASGQRWVGVVLGLMALALILGDLRPATSESEWTSALALAALPLVLPLAGLSLVQRASRWGLVMVAGGLLAGPVRLLFYEPFLDPGCAGCLPGPGTLIDSLQVAHACALAGGVVITGGALGGLRRTPRPALLGIVTAAAIVSTFSYSDVRGVLPASQTVAAWCAVVGGATRVLEMWRAHRRLERLGSALRSGTGPRDGLRMSLADPTLEIDFAPDRAAGVADLGWLDPSGWRAAGPRAGQITTEVSGEELTIARIHHSTDTGDADLLARSLTPEIRLGLEQARLSATLAAQVSELAASRVRLVERTDAQRRRLERDLHDGAQQQLLALGLDLRLALTSRDPGSDEERLLNQAYASTAEALGELRNVARGVYPTLLANAGLQPALSALARRPETTLHLGDFPTARFSAMVERAAYTVIADIARRAAEPPEVVAFASDRTLVVTVTAPSPSFEDAALERVAAAGGTIITKDNRVEVRFPCE